MFADLFRILYRPRQTIRAILDSGRGSRWVIPLVLLAFISRSVSTNDLTEVRAVLPNQPMVLMVAAIVVVSLLVVLLLFYGFSWLVTAVGRMLDGTGSARDVRIALAWGLAPLLWSLLYRVPGAILLRRMGLPENTDNPSAVLFDAISRGGCALVLVFALVDLLVLAWCVGVESVCVAEAHNISAWKALGVLAISSLSPLIIVLAAALTIAT